MVPALEVKTSMSTFIFLCSWGSFSLKIYSKDLFWVLSSCRIDLQINSATFTVPKNDCDQFTHRGERKIFAERTEVHRKKLHQIKKKSPEIALHKPTTNSWLLGGSSHFSYGEKSQRASCMDCGSSLWDMSFPFSIYGCLLPLLDQEHRWEYLKT